jgi:type I restriction enzyme, S subunit
MEKHTFPTKPLRDITLKIGSGATPLGGKNSYKTSGISLIRSLNVYDFYLTEDGLAFIDERQAAALDNVRVQENDILLNITGASVARCCLVSTRYLPARVNQHVAIVRVNPEIANARFVLYCINSPKYKSHLLALAQGGATREALTKTTIEQFHVPQPPLPIQCRVAAILSAYDNLIENNTRRIQILEEMARRIYEEWFVRFRFPGHENVKMVESELGLIPTGWSVQGLYDISELTYGLPFKSKQFNTNGEGIGVVRIRDIKNDKTNTFTNEAFDEKYLLLDGDILIGMDGEFHMGRWAGGKAALNQRVVMLRPKNGLPRYFLFLVTEKPIKHFEATIVGTTVAHLSAQDLKSTKVIIPSSEAFGLTKSLLDFLFGQEIILKKKNDVLRRTRDLLLPKLISGEIDVSHFTEPGAP